MASTKVKWLFDRDSRRWYLHSNGLNARVFEDGTVEGIWGQLDMKAEMLSTKDRTFTGYMISKKQNKSSAVKWKPWNPSHSFSRGETMLIDANKGELPVVFGDRLGSGHHATVFKVVIEGNGDEEQEEYALKQYKPKAPLEFIPKFENEIHNLQRVSHRHIARFFSAYILARRNRSLEFAILMQPVAEGDLESLISRCRSSSRALSANGAILGLSLGCLASALAHTHKHLIRHKDITPRNVLIKGRNVFLTDFGSSFDGHCVGNLSTMSPNPEGYTPRYAAPEIMTGETRNEKSDVFSLGAVFYETICGLSPEFYRPDDDYSRDLPRLGSHLLNVPKNWGESTARLMAVIYRMLNPQRDSRPSANEVVALLMHADRRCFCTSCWVDAGGDDDSEQH